MGNCPDCAKTVSLQAFTCPHCGRPLRPNSFLQFVGALIMVAGTLGALVLGVGLETALAPTFGDRVGLVAALIVVLMTIQSLAVGAVIMRFAAR